MNVLRYALVGFVLLGMATVAGAGDQDVLMKEVGAIGDALTEAMLAGDVDTMLAMYADDAISLPNYGPRMQGKAQFMHAGEEAEHGHEH